MISKRTTFVLGAGASMPYRLPSGAELRAQICSNAGGYMEGLNAQLGVDIGEMRRFADTFLRSGIYSIDAFLLMRQEFRDLGKLAIAANICVREHPPLVTNAPVSENWYQLLWNRMLVGTKNAEEVKRNRVRFVTFNYDRSLEFFLFDSAKNAFGLDDEAALRFCSHFPVLHVYGLVGIFHFVGLEQNSTRAYSSTMDAPNLRTASQKIRLIPEERSDAQVFQTARAWFDESEQVCFLGFGFDPTNCENLGLYSVLDTKAQAGKGLPIVQATTKGLIGAEVEEARTRACGSHGWYQLNADSVHLLRELGVLA